GPFLDLPICELRRLGELAELVTSVRLSRNHKDRLAMALRKGGYIPKLVEIFQECESENNTEGLRLLFDVVRGILYLDKATLFDVMFSDEYVLGVFGCLEYDPCSAQLGRHREFLAKIAELHEIMPITDPEIMKKIRQVSRARYVQTVITPDPSEFEPGFLSTLNSFINYRKREILHGLEADEAFLPGISALLTNEATAGEHRRELMRFLKEFCAFSFMFREKRREFIQTLQRLRFLRTLEKLMGIDDLLIRSLATDILSYLVEFSPTSVQEFVTQEAKQSENDTQLIIKVIEQMTCTPDPGFGGDNRLMEIFCAMIDTDKMLATASYLEVFEFLDIFYDRYIRVLTAPLLADTSENWYEIGKDNLDFFSLTILALIFLVDNYQTAEILASVLEMLSFCVERHLYHMKTYIIKTDLLRRTLALMKSKHKFLALSALRFMRKIIGMKDELYNRYITMGNLFEPVVNAVLDNRRSCNLLKSASLELFEFIQKEDIDYLIAHIVENFSDALESVRPIHTFQGLKTKYQQKEKLN
ncbi:P4R3B phosphatase, partial [Brachypodius atriceps]|nr:P4R3B phosphatase [Brachypodius atriceps]